MLKLYTKTGCPFCNIVLQKMADSNIAFEEKNISDESNLDVLLSIGGKRQIPFLVDEERDISMYESGDIVKYLEEFYIK